MRRHHFRHAVTNIIRMLTSPCAISKACPEEEQAVLTSEAAGPASVGQASASPASASSATAEPRRGRPPGTSRRELELIALRLFSEQGFDNTTIEQIAAQAGVSKRTVFRYFGWKASVLWSEFDHEVDVIREALAEVPAGVPMMDAICRAVVAANHY